MGVGETRPDDTDPWQQLQEIAHAYREAKSKGSRVRAEALRREWIALRRQLVNVGVGDGAAPSDRPPEE